MGLAEFEVHLRHAAPSFRCYRCRDRSETPSFVARLKNRIDPPADQNAICAIEGRWPAPRKVVQVL
jgi:hypothetical protein